MSKHISIGSEWFEVIKPRKHEVTPVYPTQWDYVDIFQAYVRPSECKQRIWDFWYHFKGGNGYIFGCPFISSRNCQTFTIKFNVYNENYRFVGVAIITRDHNRLYINS